MTTEQLAEKDYDLLWGKGYGEARWWVSLGDGRFTYFDSEREAVAAYWLIWIDGSGYAA